MFQIKSLPDEIYIEILKYCSAGTLATVIMSRALPIALIEKSIKMTAELYTKSIIAKPYMLSSRYIPTITEYEHNIVMKAEDRVIMMQIIPQVIRMCRYGHIPEYMVNATSTILINTIDICYPHSLVIVGANANAEVYIHKNSHLRDIMTARGGQVIDIVCRCARMLVPPPVCDCGINIKVIYPDASARPAIGNLTANKVLVRAGDARPMIYKKNYSVQVKTNQATTFKVICGSNTHNIM